MGPRRRKISTEEVCDEVGVGEEEEAFGKVRGVFRGHCYWVKGGKIYELRARRACKSHIVYDEWRWSVG